MLGSLHEQLAKCGDVADEREMLNSPLCHLTEEGHSRLSQIFDQCNEKSFAPIFAICAKEAADLAEHGDNSVGIMLLVQFLVRTRNATRLSF